MYMNVKVGQLKAHDHMRDAVREASRLADKLNADIYTVQVIGKTKLEPFYPENHGKDWTHTDDITLLTKYMSGRYTPEELAPLYKRTTWAIQCRLRTLGLGKVDPLANYRGW